MVFIRAAIFTVLVPGSVTVWISALLLSSGVRLFSADIGAFQFTGVFPIALGAALYLWCAWDFASASKGTPAPWDPPRQVIARGLYRFTRNPMYVAVGLTLLGEAIFYGSLTLLAYAGLVWLLFQLFVVFYEEPALSRKFGASYQAYCRAVPRWVPGMGHGARTE